MNIGEFFITLGFDLDASKLKEFDDRLKTATKTMAGMAAGATGVVWGVNRAIRATIDEAAQLQRLEAVLGESADNAKRLQNALAELAPTLDLNYITSAMEQISLGISAAASGQYPEGWAALGLGDVRGMDSMDVLNKLRENNERNQANWKEGYNQRLSEAGFLDLKPLITAPNETWDKLMNMPIPDEKARNAWFETAQAIKEFSTSFSNMKTNLGEGLSPKIASGIDDLKAAIEGIGKAINWVSEMWDNHTWSIIKSVSKYIGIIGIVAGLILGGPWIAAIAGATGLLVVFREIGKLVKGSSVFSPIIDFLSSIPALVENSIKWLDKFINKISNSKFAQWVLGFLQSEEDSPIGKAKKRLEELGLGDAKGIIPNGTMGNYPLRQRDYPPQPFPVSNDYSTHNNVQITSRANARDLVGELSNVLENKSARNAMLDNMYGVSGNAPYFGFSN